MAVNGGNNTTDIVNDSEWNQDKNSRIIEAWNKLSTLTTITSAALLALLVEATPANAQAQETYDYTPAVVTESGESCDTPNSEFTRSELNQCFQEDLSQIEDPDLQTLLVELLESYSSEQLNRAIWLFAWWFTAVEAIAIVADNNDRTSEVIRIIHARAIELGKWEYTENMITQAPLFTQWRWADLPEERKLERAWADYDDIMTDFLTGNDNGSLERFVDYAPSFAQYVARFPNDFPLAEQLLLELNIAESEANIAESEVNIAESKEIQAALLELQRSLQGDV